MENPALSAVDVAIIGAGIQGAGVAQAATAAGYSVIVLEKEAIAAGTSSKSSKLIHGGLRYLESYQFSLVRKSLKERAILCRIAPNLVKLQPFYIPIYKNTTRRPWMIRLGLSLYAVLGGLRKENLFKAIKPEKIICLDKLESKNLQKLFRYYDGQTNDVDLTKAVMHSAISMGALLKCSADVVSIEKETTGFNLSYIDGAKKKNIHASIVVNASGPWVNELLELVKPKAKALDVDLVQGTHIIIDAPAPSGIYYLEAKDKRAVFVMPYKFNGQLKTMVGTTEKLFKEKADDTHPSNEEVDYLLSLYKTYFSEYKNAKVIHTFSGLRVLPIDNGSMFARPRDTILQWTLPGLLTLYGGKLTAYRSTAELVIKKIKKQLPARKRIAYTKELLLNKNEL